MRSGSRRLIGLVAVGCKACWLSAASVALGPNRALAADLTARQLTEALFKASSGQPLDFAGKDLSLLDLAGLDFKGAGLAHANMFGTDLTRSNLTGANLTGVRLDRAVMLSADFSGANLAGASLLRPSVNIMLDKNRADAPKFAGANLRGIRLTAMMDGADFRGADLTDANVGPHDPRADMSSMPGSILRGSDFSGANMERADFMWAKLSFSKFTGANLRDVNFVGADLSMCDFSGADFTGANLLDADLDGANLSGAKGLDKVNGMDAVKNFDRTVR